MKKVSDVFKSIRFAKGETRGKKHSSTDDEEHGTVGEMEFDQQLAHAKKRTMQEAKDPGEYDQEGDMAMTQLRSIIYHAQELHDQLDKNDNLPEWVQSKITLAQDYMQTACDYMYSQKNEEVKKATGDLKDTCWTGYTAVGMKMKNGRKVPNCVPTNEEVEQLEEGRPSQRHPLEGHEYHKKTDAELVHIAKDAHKAAEAMKSHNTTAENKYRDQANDSATVRHYRQKNGMPDWYKKKYGHVKEGVVNEVMDEPNYKNSIQARQKKADDANKPPFDGPYTTGPSTVTDKSGAIHGPMSRVRDLARAAAKRQAQKMPVKEGLEESRKAEIVKEIMKKGKKKEDNSFQAEPVIGSTVVKADN
jgi:hypothetical protein